MRVVLFTDTFLPKIDGIVTVIRLLLEHLQQRGITVMVVCPDLGSVDEYAGARVVRVPGVPFPLYPGLRFAWPLYGTYRKVRAFSPDVAHFIHAGFTPGSGMLMALRLGIPRVVSFHLDYARLAPHFGIGFARPAINALTRLMFNRADACLAPSTPMLARMREIGIRPPISVWGRGVDADAFHPRFRSVEMRARLSSGCPGDLLMLYVGRLSFEKRLGDLRAVLEQVPGTRLALVGDGPERASLEAHFTGLPVTFSGYLTGESLAAAYASADLFVFPSALETFGLAATEAMASGLPVVGARVGGIPDVVQDGVTGYTFAPGDVGALVAAVRRVAAERDRLPEMSRAARAFAETQTWPAMMDGVVDLYEQVIVRRRAPYREHSAHE